MKKIISITLATIILVIGIVTMTGCSNKKDYTNNPDPNIVVSILNTIDGIDDVEIYEVNDEMYKMWCYHTSIYFSFNQIPEEEREYMSGTPAEVGTVGGGSIEICDTKEEAEERNAYLSTFDGAGVFDSGSHVVAGTLVIRTSCYLTTEQQTNLTNAIIDAFNNYTE